jgi:hypothetical protein
LLAPKSPHLRQMPVGILSNLAKTVGIRPALAGSGQNGRDLARYDMIRPLILSDPEASGWNPAILARSCQTFSSESGNCYRTLSDSSDICQTLIFAFCNFFVRAKHRKIFSKKIIFSENNFVEIILRRKSFYVKTNGALISNNFLIYEGLQIKEYIFIGSRDPSPWANYPKLALSSSRIILHHHSKFKCELNKMIGLWNCVLIVPQN